MFPRLVSFRDKDKQPEDATTAQELIEMYQNRWKIPSRIEAAALPRQKRCDVFVKLQGLNVTVLCIVQAILFPD